jgi:inosose dehydratase
VLGFIAGAGFEGTELGPFGYMPTDAAVLRAGLERHGLELVGGYVFEPLHTAAGRERAVAAARALSPLLAAAGARHLVVIPGFTPERERAAGRRDEARSLPDPYWQSLLETVDELARIASGDGLTAVFHPHAGTDVEFDDEIERFANDSDVPLCIDTGHCAYSGIDPVALYERHAGRVAYLHLKDVEPDALSRALAAGRSFDEAVGDGVFCPLGNGAVDFGALAEALSAHGFEGWATVEQDRLPGETSAPAKHAGASLAHLRAVGLA